MATKKKPNGKALIKTIVKGVVNHHTVLPILTHVYLTGDQLQVTDLETSVVLPFNSGIEACFPADKFLDVLEMMDEPQFSCGKNFAIEITEGKRKVKVMGEDPQKFVKVFAHEDYFEFGEFNADTLKLLATALPFTSNDDLRPALTSVFVGKDIAATDAHRLFWHPIEPLMAEFLLPKKTVNLLLKIGGENWKVYGTMDALTVIFINEAGVVLSTRTIDARYPDYPVVIPQDENRVTFVVNPDALRREIKNAMKFSNTATHQMNLCLNGKATITAQDVDLSFEYHNEMDKNDVEISFHKTRKIPIGTRIMVGDKKGKIVGHKGIYHHVKFDDDHERAEPTVLLRPAITIVPEFNIAFNGELLDDIAEKLNDEPITMRMWSPTKAAIINDHFLLMPLMLNE